MIGRSVWKPLVQKAITGHGRRFRMIRQQPSWPERLLRPGLYLHVPFCKNLCPYCPYNRVEYSDNAFEAYERAVKEEVDLYGPYLQGTEFSSLYIGGGTPTVNWPGLISILAHLGRRLKRPERTCIELHPSNMANDCLKAIKDAGINTVSIGVESTSDVLLRRIQRSHDGPAGIDAVRRAMVLDFSSINVDLMFALPGETLEEWKEDVMAIVDLGVGQISTYPMFAFPYTDLGASEQIRAVQRPSHRVVKEMLDFTDDVCEAAGLHRCAVWSWLRPGKPKFSSITRHHYIGFGPSAASMTGNDFYVNTFSVAAYVKALPLERPVALSMKVDRRLEMAYWLYWRIYELQMTDSDFKSVFGSDASIEREFGPMLRPLLLAGLLKAVEGGYRVTKAGAYWIHRLQNEYSLNYINNLWGTCRKQPWPGEVRL